MIEDLQSSVLIQLGLAMRSYRQGEPLNAIRHLSKAAESISVIIESMSISEVEEP